MRNKILMIGLDSAEPGLIENWINDGSLPNLRSVFTNGKYKKIGKPNELVLNPWISFFSGLEPGDHGIYHYINWDPRTLQTKRIFYDEVGLVPFWHHFNNDSAPRTIAVDLPMTTPPDKLNGIEINGFANHEILVPFYTYPGELRKFVKSEFGDPCVLPEKYGLHTGSELLKLKDQLIELTGRKTVLTKHFLTSEQWDLFMVVYGEIHRAGHKLWNLSGMVDGEPESLKIKVKGAMKEVYQACDRSVGELIRAAGEDTNIIIFSLHGMGENTSRIGIFPEMLSRVVKAEAETDGSARYSPAASIFRRLMPLSLRQSIKQRLPMAIQDYLTAYWRMGGIDWESTPAFSLVGDVCGLVRINLVGREARGIVQPGEEYEHWLNAIDMGLRTYLDSDTGRPVVSEVIRRDRYFSKGDHFENLPDLFVVWDSTPSCKHREIISPDYGSIAWPIPHHDPDGRSGNHMSEGFLIASGENFLPGKPLLEIKIQDISATVLDLFGLEIPAGMVGKSIVRRN
jgi:predicted AlkP superfamily phosphohydrolase/phosphomutase